MPALPAAVLGAADDSSLLNLMANNEMARVLIAGTVVVSAAAFLHVLRNRSRGACEAAAAALPILAGGCLMGSLMLTTAGGQEGVNEGGSYFGNNLGTMLLAAALVTQLALAFVHLTTSHPRSPPSYVTAATPKFQRGYFAPQRVQQRRHWQTAALMSDEDTDTMDVVQMRDDGNGMIPIRGQAKHNAMLRRHELEEVGADTADAYSELEKLVSGKVNVGGAFLPGSVVNGTVVSADRAGLQVDCGTKRTAMVPWTEASLSRDREDFDDAEAIGQTMEFQYLYENRDEVPILSLRRLQIVDALNRLQEKYETRAEITVRLLSENRGGFVAVTDEGIRGFLPRSRSCGEAVGDEVTVQLIELMREDDDTRVKVIVSSKDVRLREVEADALVTGTVGAHRPYGTFINDINGIKGMNGLLHISQTSFSLIRDPTEVLPKIFPVGSTVKAVVMSKAGGRVELGTKVLEETPGEIMTDPANFFQEADQRYEKYLGAKSMDRSLESLIGDVFDDVAPEEDAEAAAEAAEE